MQNRQCLYVVLRYNSDNAKIEQIMLNIPPLFTQDAKQIDYEPKEYKYFIENVSKEILHYRRLYIYCWVM